ncbi:hypothetical protein ZWY2020_015044 [Hordeum vulgare]|nr:hypothetical protein ZWY2020_015044 [Hordeum vulgare]
MRGPTAAAAFRPGRPPPAAEEVVERTPAGGGARAGALPQVQKLLQLPVAPSPCRILTARDLHPAAALSPDSSVSSSSPAAAKPEDGPAPAASPGTLASGHPQSCFTSTNQNYIFSPLAVALGGGMATNKNIQDEQPVQPGQRQCLGGRNQKAAADDSGSQKDKEEGEKKGQVPGWVKVNMDGEVIGRKVDLNAHRSYKTLALALEIMFTKPSAGLCASNATKSLKLLDNSSEYQMTYEDRDGDWMLVGDNVCWLREELRIMRTSDASGLKPRFQASHRTAALTRGGHETRVMKSRRPTERAVCRRRQKLEIRRASDTDVPCPSSQPLSLAQPL